MNTSIIFRTIHKISDVLDPEIGGIYCESSSGSQYIYDGKSFRLVYTKSIRYSRPYEGLILGSSISVSNRIRLILLTNKSLKDEVKSKISSILLTKKDIVVTTRDQRILRLMDISKCGDNLTGSIVEFKVNKLHDVGTSLIRMFVPNNTPTNIDIYEVLMSNINELMKIVYDNT